MSTLTAAEIDDMPAGREMDALVAEKVLGWTEIARQTFCGYPPEKVDQARPFEFPARLGAFPVPHYSTDIAAVWEVVGALTRSDRRFGGFCLQVGGFAMGEDHYNLNIPDGAWGACFDLGWENATFATAPIPALAICRAALKATLGAT